MITNNRFETLSVKVYTTLFIIFSWLVQKVQNDFVIYLHSRFISINQWSENGYINQISMINDQTELLCWLIPEDTSPTHPSL